MRETPFRLLGEKANVIARVAWWLLQKMGVLEPWREKVESWTYVPHNQEPLHEAILAALDHDLRYVYEGKAVVIIGGKDFSDLAMAPVFRESVSLMTGPFCMGDGYGGRKIFDVPIHVVPHMTGLAVVPKAIIETR